MKRNLYAMLYGEAEDDRETQTQGRLVRVERGF
jgi:hypothetical protein